MRFITLKRGVWFAFLIMAVLGSSTGIALGQDENSELKNIKKEIDVIRDELHRTIEEKQKKIDDLERQIQTLRATPTAQEEPKSTQSAAAEPKSGESALDKAVRGLEQYQEHAQKGDLYSQQVGGATLRLMDISFDILFDAGTSTEPDSSIKILEGGDHDPKRRGFTLGQAEIGVQGAVDPYFTAEGYIVYKEDGVELEEAFAKTTSLPLGLQAKMGYFLTEFGIMNPTHPHAWEWIDQPVIVTRLLGGEGTRGSGVRLSWLSPLPWFSELSFSMQNATNDTEVSFLGLREDPGIPDIEGSTPTIGGRPVVDRNISSLADFLYMARWENSFDLSRETTTKFGFSGLLGPNNTGPNGSTRIYGADLKVKWRPAINEGGWPFVLWQSEVMGRDYKTDGFFSDTGGTAVDLPATTLHDWGFYTQLLYGFHRDWAAGLRLEYASGGKASVISSDGTLVFDREEDPYRDNRIRISPLLSWYLSEFSRFRLQFNYDHADHLDHDAYSTWLGAEFLIGSHPAHKY